MTNHSSMTRLAVALTCLLVCGPQRVLAQGTSGVIPDDDTISTECKFWSLCCENEICTNNCRPVPMCPPDWDGVGEPGNPNFAVLQCEAYYMYTCCRDGNGCGDPHFQTWAGDVFDYHGQCDLVFVKAPSFGKGLGLDIQVRTTIRFDYSFIESAAIKIGDDIFEVSGWGEHFYNGVESARFPIELGKAFPVEYERLGDNHHSFTIFVGDHGQNIVVKSFKDFVSVKFNNAAADDFRDSTGILGNFMSLQRLARDGKTVIDDDNAYGQEWQVQPLVDGPSLFQSDRAPQYPTAKCILPEVTMDERRRLGETKVSEEEAAAACSHWASEFKEACVYDVLATGDLEMAQAGAY